MKKYLIISLMLIFAGFTVHVQAQAVYKPDDTFTESKPFILLDFDKKLNVNNIGGLWGGFDANPNDKNAYCKTKFSKDTDLHKTGVNLKVTYSVESDQTAYNGIWTKLNGLNLSKFQAISLTVKGNKVKGFNDSFKMEIKDTGHKISGQVEDITSEWKKIIISFDEFEGDPDMDMSKLNEFTIVFEDWKFGTKKGEYYIDDISFIPKKDVTVKYSDMVNSGEKQKQ